MRPGVQTSLFLARRTGALQRKRDSMVGVWLIVVLGGRVRDVIGLRTCGIVRGYPPPLRPLFFFLLPR